MLTVLVGMSLLTGLVSTPDATPGIPIAELTRAIEECLPANWTLKECVEGEIPMGHHFGRRYAGPRGYKLVVVGPEDVNLCWRSRDGEEHREALAKEALHIWIMPDKYRNSFISRVNPKRPILPKLIHDDAFRVYAEPSHKLVVQERFDSILSKASMTSWPGSPEHTGVLSWKNWRSDVKACFARLDAKETPAP